LLFVHWKKAYDSVMREVLYNIVIEFVIPHITGKANKKSQTETYSLVQVGKTLCDVSPVQNGLKQVDAISHLLLNFAFDYAIKRV